MEYKRKAKGMTRRDPNCPTHLQFAVFVDEVMARKEKKDEQRLECSVTHEGQEGAASVAALAGRTRGGGVHCANVSLCTETKNEWTRKSRSASNRSLGLAVYLPHVSTQVLTCDMCKARPKGRFEALRLFLVRSFFFSVHSDT